MIDGSAPAAGARVVLSVQQRWALLAAFALLVMLRLPLAWLHGRFLTEEGTIFFAYAWHRPAGDALFRSFAGYLNLGANGMTLLAARLVQAGLLPLVRAPYLTMVAALAVQLLPAALLLTGRARWLEGRWAVAAGLLILATAPQTEEVFANVLHIQFHLALAAALILAFEPARTRVGRTGHGAILFLAPLCGPGAIVLLPLFALRALVDRDRTRLAQLLVFAAGAALQLLLFFTPSPIRGDLLDPATIAAIMSTRLIALPLVGPELANKLGRWLHLSWAAGGIGWWSAAAGAIAWFAALVALALRDRRDGAVWLALAGLGIGAASFGGGMIATPSREWFSVGSGERYNFLPLALLSLALVALARQPGGRARRTCLGLCLLTLVNGARLFPFPLKELGAGPAWPAEVAAWRLDHARPLAGWPRDWTIDLSDEDRPCPPPRPGQDASADPGYCESAWLTRVERATARAARRKS